MAINFPTSIDSPTTKTTSDDVDASHMNDVQSMAVALETKVGVDGSAVTTSHDYKLDRLCDPGRAVGTSNISTTSTSYIDMTDMSVSKTVAGGAALVLFSGTIRLSHEHQEGYLNIEIDSTVKHESRFSWSAYESGEFRHWHLSWLETGLSAASHTFKVQWKTSGGTIYQDGATYTRSLVVLEFPG